jgi:DNA-binding IclR family transcriptional regulator
MVGIGDDRGDGMNRLRSAGPYSGRERNSLHAEHDDDGADQRDDQRLNQRNPQRCKQQDQQHVEAGDQHAVKQRNVEEQLSAMAEPITSARSQAAMAISAPTHKAEAHPAAIALAAKLRQIALRGHAQLEAQALQQDRHQVRDHDDRTAACSRTASRRQCRWPSCRGPCSRRR